MFNARCSMRFLSVLVVIAAGLPHSVIAATDVDLLIENARIIDGSGNPWFRGNVAITDGKILSVGVSLDVNPRNTIDARGRVVSPGFIDIHTHIESGIVQNPQAHNFLFDGVTTVVTGNCGSSTVDVAGWRKTIIDPAINIATLIGHNSVRKSVMGRENRAPTAVEMSTMAMIVERAMLEGAIGLSTGLLYIPGTFSSTDEVINLARVAAKFDGIYATHLRDQGALLHESIDEAVTIAREARLPVQISHLKIKGPARWGQIGKTIELIEQYRDAGIDITVDAYPYEQASTGLSVMLPAWVQEGSAADLLARISDPETAHRIREEMKAMLIEGGYDDYSFATVANYLSNPALNGRTISEIILHLEREASIDQEVNLILELMTERAKQGDARGPQMVYHFMSIEDVEEIYRYHNVAVASDGGIRKIGQGLPHPRSYGTNARVISRFVRDNDVLTLADAIRKMTSLPAQISRMNDRGLIRPGYAADLVLFDPQSVQDDSTYADPHQYSRGFDYVIVNGIVVIDEGKLTDARPGQFIDGRGAQ